MERSAEPFLCSHFLVGTVQETQDHLELPECQYEAFAMHLANHHPSLESQQGDVQVQRAMHVESFHPIHRYPLKEMDVTFFLLDFSVSNFRRMDPNS